MGDVPLTHPLEKQISRGVADATPSDVAVHGDDRVGELAEVVKYDLARDRERAAQWLDELAEDGDQALTVDGGARGKLREVAVSAMRRRIGDHFVGPVYCVVSLLTRGRDYTVC
jgi:hypothetical protein